MRNSKNCKKVSVSVPEQLLRDIDEMAESKDQSRSKVIVKAIEFMFKIKEGGSYL